GRRADGDGGADARSGRPGRPPGSPDPGLVPGRDPRLRRRRLRNRGRLSRIGRNLSSPQAPGSFSGKVQSTVPDRARRAPAAVLEAAGATALALTSPLSRCKDDRGNALSLVPGTPHIRGTIPRSGDSPSRRSIRHIFAANQGDFPRYDRGG